jgi:hypothetical protein
MTPDKMVHMANQIALFFASYPHDEAVAGVADHINKFWEPACVPSSSRTSPQAVPSFTRWSWRARPRSIPRPRRRRSRPSRARRLGGSVLLHPGQCAHEAQHRDHDHREIGQFPLRHRVTSG